MPPAGKVSGFHREGDDWYSLSKSYMLRFSDVETPMNVVVG